MGDRLRHCLSGANIFRSGQLPKIDILNAIAPASINPPLLKIVALLFISSMLTRAVLSKALLKYLLQQKRQQQITS